SFLHTARATWDGVLPHAVPITLFGSQPQHGCRASSASTLCRLQSDELHYARLIASKTLRKKANWRWMANPSTALPLSLRAKAPLSRCRRRAGCAASHALGSPFLFEVM